MMIKMGLATLILAAGIGTASPVAGDVGAYTQEEPAIMTEVSKDAEEEVIFNLGDEPAEEELEFDFSELEF